MKPLSRTVRVVVSEHGHSSPLPDHPSSYEITDPGEVREVLATLEEAPRPAPDDFVCMCGGEPSLALYDAGGQRIRSVHGHRPPLLDPARSHSLPLRHRAAWAAAAPPVVRDWAAARARGADAGPGTAPDAPLGLVFSWLGTPWTGGDAARLLARAAPLALLAAAATEELAWAVRQTDAAGLDGAVDFFAGEGFTTRHPKKRRVGATARDLLLRHARRHRPEHLPVLERRVLRAAEDRIRR
ncbi:hypothetical protein [Streptomyces palmae]|uniref:Uncharacterized protein n=1 Tax=Streptomyces palmae TaxID=1701085 RepID=A0A4Z0HCN9_9ACTN|nr:hypothetical protein [Streptomyces palmae]TGB15788.1 hypothetical protein E4099_06165 [Streptomyces palmae]